MSWAFARSSFKASVLVTSQEVRASRVSSLLAISKGSSPERSLILGSAPRSSSSCTVSWWPWKAERCSGVRPSLPAAFGSLPIGAFQSSRYRTVSRWPCTAASANGVFSRPSLAIGSAPFSSNALTSSSSPSNASSKRSSSILRCSLDFSSFGLEPPAQVPALFLISASEHTTLRTHICAARDSGTSSRCVMMMSRKPSFGSNLESTSATLSGAWAFVRS
mmetsp:Transcript_59206/g.103607  ORF Transcript_59206/g.103607 Transcript_59206/m.103607 type:complete len:220 (+) Transcript_59206:200-859(+)